MDISMDIRKLLSAYDDYSLMDNSCKSLDGRIYKTVKRPKDEFNTKDLMAMDIDYAILIWSDFANSHSNDHVVLKDRNI